MKQIYATNCASAQGATRVLKKLAPTNRGAIKLARQYGEALICVRHRTDEKHEFRFTTVELLVEKVPIVHRASPDAQVRIGPTEFNLQALVRSTGARWDSRVKAWVMPRRRALALGLGSRIVKQK